MMTGYTHKMIEDNQDFPTFVLSCAREIDYLCLWRDEKTLPDPLTVNPWYDQEIEKEREKLRKIERNVMMVGIDAEGETMKRLSIEEIEAALKGAQKEYLKATEMEAQVKAWSPSTEKHASLKRFMLEQLSGITRHKDASYLEERLEKFCARAPHQFVEDAIRAANDRILYLQQQKANEEGHVREAQEWLDTLKASLIGVK